MLNIIPSYLTKAKTFNKTE